MGEKVEIAPIGVVDNSSFITKLNDAINTVSDEFDDVLYRDGSTPMDGDLNMDGNRIYNLPAPLSDHEPARLLDVEQGLRGPVGPDTAEALEVFEGVLENKADLVDGIIPFEQLPPIDTTGYRGLVASQAAMLATVATLGNYVIRTDTDPDTVWYLTALPSTSLANWTQTGAAASVSSVAGKTGTVTLTKTDVGLANVDNTSDANKPVSTAQSTALDLKVDKTSISAVAGQVLDDTSFAAMRATLGLANVENTTDLNKPISTATAAALAGKATDAFLTRTALHYGAVGDGSTDDYTSLLSALQSGFIIDGLGKTYAISAQLAPTSFKGLKNATLKWSSTAAMQVQGRGLLRITNLDNWVIDYVKFDMGTVENIGATGAPDNVRSGFVTSNSGTSDHCWITNCEVFGHGAGTGLELRNLKNAVISGNYVHDRTVDSTGITNDAQNGIQLDNVFDSVITGNIVARLYLRIAGVLTKKWSRGYCITSCQNITVTGNNGSFVDQCFDFSGGVTPQPNRGITVTGNSVEDVGTFGYKFANVSRDFIISGNMVRRYGFAGFVWSQNSVEGANQTQNHLCVGNYAYDFTGEYNGSGAGFYIIGLGGNGGYPRNIRIESCGVYGSVGGTMVNAFLSTAVLGNPLMPNTLVNCHANGHTGAMQSGFHMRFAKASYTQNVTSGAAVIATLAAPTGNNNTMSYWVAGQPTRLTAPEAGVYRVIARAVYAANSTGFRGLGVNVGGGNISGDSQNAVAGTATTLQTVTEYSVAAGAYFELVLEQNSGSTLSTEINFQIEYVRPA